MDEKPDNHIPAHSIDELEIFERVLDKQITIGENAILDIKVSVAPLEEVEEQGLDLKSLTSKPAPLADTEAAEA